MAVNEVVPEVKKILVKCPPKKEDGFNIFPFLIALSEEYPKAEIMLLCEEGTSQAYHFLPFKVRAFERPKEKLTLIETHHYCANLNDIFNIDLFFDLENSFNSSFMGYNFRAKERVGYIKGWNKYLLSKKYFQDENLCVEKKSVRLLEHYMGKTVENLKISRIKTEGMLVEKIDQLFKEPEPPKFIMIMLDNFKNVSMQIETWKKFFDNFENQKFIIWSMHDEEEISELFARIDLGKNSLYMHKGASPKELVYVLNKVVGVVTNNFWSEGLCTYYGSNAISILSNIDQEIPNYHHFVFKPQRFIIEGEKIIFKAEEEDKEILEMNQIVDHIHFHFKL